MGTSTLSPFPHFQRGETADVKGSLGLSNQTYFNSHEPSYNNGAQGDNFSFRLDARGDLRVSPKFYAHMDVSDQFSASESWNYADVHELYASYGGSAVRTSVGRKLDTWAEWESVWQQGVFQPRYIQDPLNPEAAGLTGVFLQGQGAHWGGALGLLPINIPDFGPHFMIKDDRFVSQNPWFQAPAAQFMYNDVVSDLHYSLHSPSLQEVAFKPGLAAKAEYRLGPSLTRLAYSYKPAPQLALGFASRGLVRLPNFAQVTIDPRVVYDRVINLDERIDVGAWTFSASVAYDNPEREDGPDGWTAQTYSPAWIFSGWASHRFDGKGEHATRLSLGFLRVAGGDGPDVGDLAGEQTKFTRRFEYYEAYLLELKKELRVGLHNPLATKVRLTYDRLQDGGVISLGAEYKFQKNWRADVNVDYIGLLSPSPAQINDGFLATFRANDRIGLGVSYVF